MHFSFCYCTKKLQYDKVSFNTCEVQKKNLIAKRDKMPLTKKIPVDTSAPVLVTGGTGYVAGVLIGQLLDRGLTVHTTVRDPSQTERLSYLTDYASQSPGSLKFFAADLLKEGSFAEAMTGCSIVFHTASPFITNVKDPQAELVDPALKGTTNVLEAVNQTASVTRVVLTSSVAAIFSDCADTSKEDPTTEETWNTTSSLTHLPYFLSKTLAEKKAWEMAKAQDRWTLCSINPGTVFGPGLRYHETSESFRFVMTVGTVDPSTRLGAADLGFAVVASEDVAAAHIAGAFLPEAAGQRYICNAGTKSLPELGAALKEKYGKEYHIVSTPAPSLMFYIVWLVAPLLGLSRTYVKKNWGYKAYFDNSKSKKELGLEYTNVDKAIQDMYQQMIDNGVVSKK